MTRLLAAGVLAASIVAVALLLFSGGGGYRATAEFLNAGQLVEGNLVQVGGAQIGSVERIHVTSDGRAEVTFAVDDEAYTPLREGTKAVVRQTSLSGIANRFIDLHLRPAGATAIDDGGRIGPDDTSAAVELDQVFNLFEKETRRAVADVFEGSAEAIEGARPAAAPRRPLPRPPRCPPEAGCSRS